MWKYSDIRRGVTIEYRLTQSYNYLDRLTYGIDVEMYANDGLADRASVYDAFCTRSEAESFIVLLAENGVEPCHLKEVVIDRLSKR